MLYPSNFFKSSSEPFFKYLGGLCWILGLDSEQEQELFIFLLPRIQKSNPKLYEEFKILSQSFNDFSGTSQEGE